MAASYTRRASVHDVAAYILQKQSPMLATKLEKLAYYSKAWSIVWDSDELFPEEMQAWASGPICPNLYNIYKGEFYLSQWASGSVDRLSDTQRETVDAVLAHYGGKSANWLGELTRLEEPWRKAREGLKPSERSDRVITSASLEEYYSAIWGCE